jgi:hypothetical protein
MVSRDQIAAALWNASHADTMTWTELLRLADLGVPGCAADRDRTLAQADAVLALPEIARLLAVEIAARRVLRARAVTQGARVVEALREALGLTNGKT